MNFKSNFLLFVFGLLVLSPFILKAQLTAPGSVATETTSYPAFPETDNIYIFCAENADQAAGALLAQTDLAGSKTFLWEKYNNQTGEFEFYSSETTEAQEASVTNLPNGAYRVTITQGTESLVYRAWVFNSWFTATAEVTESTCESFSLQGGFDTGELNYYDLSTNAPVELVRNINVEWYQGETLIASVINTQVIDPPATNTDYTLRVFDRFGCQATANVTYESVVTEAAFTVDPATGEAPLTVTFNNQSVNGDPGQYEWFFYHDLDYIKQQQPADSVQFIAIDDSPVYTFENSGIYNVKLVSKNISSNVTCTDTVYIDEFIVVDTSFVLAPNVFTPNGDGVNDEFVVKYWSMESIRISIFNRWGKRIHFWESEDVQGFDGTREASAWDGRIGNRMASPGVYYYTVAGTGRDGHERRARGFVHLFRGKD